MSRPVLPNSPLAGCLHGRKTHISWGLRGFLTVAVRGDFLTILGGLRNILAASGSSRTGRPSTGLPWRIFLVLSALVLGDATLIRASFLQSVVGCPFGDFIWVVFDALNCSWAIASVFGGCLQWRRTLLDLVGEHFECTATALRWDPHGRNSWKTLKALGVPL